MADEPGLHVRDERAGSGYVIVRRGDRKSGLPMHGGRNELGTGLVNAVKKQFGAEVMLRYRILVQPDDNDTLLVTCPDLPSVFTYGTDADDALVQALDAIETMLASMTGDIETVPLRRTSAEPSGPFVQLPLQTELKVRLYEALRQAGLSRADLQRRLGWQRESVDRLFRLGHKSRMDQIEAAFRALGKTIDIEVREAA